MASPSSLLKKLQNFGEEKCHVCSEGTYKPAAGIRCEHCYVFLCDKCGAILSFTPRFENDPARTP